MLLMIKNNNNNSLLAVDAVDDAGLLCLQLRTHPKNGCDRTITIPLAIEGA